MPSEPVTFEHFEIARQPDGSLHELGRGAMGVTYKAFDTRLGSHVALKVINADAIQSEVGRVRFEREAKAAAHLNHPNVAAIFHRGQEGGAYFYAMQFIEGETFDAFVKRRGPLPAALALRLILQAAQGLSAASARGLIHRDIKPSNLMLVHPEQDADPAGDDAGPDEEDLLVKVIDFGLAKYLNKPGDTTDVSLTGDRIIGTPYYMSPEQIDPVGKEIDARADIYSLGVTLWHLLSGNPPFRGTEFQVFNQHMNHSLPWEQLPASVPPPVHDLLERMMAKDAADRPAGHRELIALLKQQLRALAADGTPGHGIAAPRPGPGAAVRPDVVEQSADHALPPADFSLADVLQARGTLTKSEVLGLLSVLAPVVDAKREEAGQGYDLAPGRIFVRFDLPSSQAADLLAQPLDAWPPSQLEVVVSDPEMAAPVGSHPARPLGELAYTLLAGRPAADPYEPVASVNERGNAVLRRVLEATDAYGTAAKFAEAFRLSLAGELHVPTMPAASSGGGASTGWEAERDYTTVPVHRSTLRREKTWLPAGGLTVLGFLVALAAGWWFAGGGMSGTASWSPGAVYARLHPAQGVPPAGDAPKSSAPAAAVAAPDGLAVGSITTRAVRRSAPPPYYPPAAKAAHQRGTVLLNVDVDAVGNVTGTAVVKSSGFPLLDDAAMQAVRAWKFDPARTNQVAVPSRTEQSIEFKPPPGL